jgi:hypothetical protein
MRVALLTTYAAGRKEPLAEMLQRIYQAFSGAGLGEPAIRFNFGDGPLAGSVSSVDRVLKRHPELARFVTTAVPPPLIQGARRITNDPLSPAAGEAVPFPTLHAIAAGVPRSFPFHGIAMHFHAPEFGELLPASAQAPEMVCGILVGDSWWVNGRNRSLSACTLVEADPASKKLPSPPAAVAAVLAALGKAKRALQAPLWSASGEAAAPGPVQGPVPGVRLPSGAMIASAKPEAARAVQAITADYRARLPEIVVRAALPHVHPEPGAVPLGVTAGPKKPALESVFRPMGYTCRGESGSFTLRRRTSANLTVELHLDVGTWSHSVLAMFRIWGLGFKGLLALPVGANAHAAAQYPIGDAARWQQIVENLGALVHELERSLVPEIEAAVGPSPAWYQPEG